MKLNDRAAAVVRQLLADPERFRVETTTLPCGAMVVDCGVNAAGGVAAGVMLARACLADLGRVEIEAATTGFPRPPVAALWEPGAALGPAVTVQTDHPRLACMAAQYAGWEIKGDDYFAMGSGPMRAAAAREPLFEQLDYRESPEVCVGVLEASQLPTDDAATMLAEKCGVSPAKLTLLVAPTRSLAGTVQIVARSVETALHKLHELHADLTTVESGWGCAPLPPPADDDLAAIGRTNDAILYGGTVVLFMRGDDVDLADLAHRLPSNASRDYGRPFAEVLAAYNHDFYQVDPLLFSPAVVTLVNLATGRSFCGGEINAEVLARSFGQSS